jgi:hypothetical protein
MTKCKECKFHVYRRLTSENIDPPRYHHMCRHPAVTMRYYHINRSIQGRDFRSRPIWCPLAGGEIS